LGFYPRRNEKKANSQAELLESRAAVTTLKTIPLAAAAYRPYGTVIAPDPSVPSAPANQGTAERYNRLGRVENLRHDRAAPNLCVFSCQPFTGTRFEVRLLEKHPHSTQVFIPMSGEAERYLVVVCLGGDEPDLSTLRAFIARKDQGVTYLPGVWHHPLIALDHPTNFACLVWEDGSAGDCETRTLIAPVAVDLS
jgi:ureidoglycolate lyase